MQAARITTDDGVGLAVVEEGGGSPLLVVHGFSGAKEDFTEHFEALGRDHRVVAFDHRGHMDSDQPADLAAYSLVRLAADVLCVADALDLTTFRLLGHSMGGMVAQHVVLTAPERVEALILMETSPGPPDGVSVEDARRAGEIALAEGMASLRAAMEGRDVMASPAHERVLRERPEHQAFGDRKFEAQSPHAYAALAREMVERTDCSEALRAVRCPTLVIVGEQDAAFHRGSLRLADVIPGARLARIPDAGHNPQFENPIAWRSTVREFLAGLDR